MAATTYDSAKVRRAAREVRALSGDLEDGFSGAGHSAIEETARLRGKAADALGDRLRELNKRVTRLCVDLDAIGGELNSYASQLEATAQKLRTEMQRG